MNRDFTVSEELNLLLSCLETQASIQSALGLQKSGKGFLQHFFFFVIAISCKTSGKHNSSFRKDSNSMHQRKFTTKRKTNGLSRIIRRKKVQKCSFYDLMLKGNYDKVSRKGGNILFPKKESNTLPAMVGHTSQRNEGSFKVIPWF